jgi:hypothetical protein
MKKEDINNILLVNGYLVSCELDKNCCKKKIQLTRKYLSGRINKALKSRTEKNPINFKALLVNILLVLGFNL